MPTHGPCHTHGLAPNWFFSCHGTTSKVNGTYANSQPSCIAQWNKAYWILLPTSHLQTSAQKKPKIQSLSNTCLNKKRTQHNINPLPMNYKPPTTCKRGDDEPTLKCIPALHGSLLGSQKPEIAPVSRNRRGKVPSKLSTHDYWRIL